MPDFFAILGQPRLPALDLEQLREAFLRRSTEAHPDKAGPRDKPAAEKQFAEINAAYNILRHSRPRLLHLLELEGLPPVPHVQSAPPEVTPFFAPVAELTRAADEFLARRRKASSPMLQAQFFAEALDWTDQIQAVQSRLHQQIRALEDELLPMNLVWAKAPPLPDLTRAAALPLERVQQITTILGFFERWNSQLQERLTALAF